MIEISESFSMGDVASLCVDALKSEDLSESVVKAWENTGTYPISYEKMERKMEQYCPLYRKWLSQEESAQVETVLMMTEEHLDKLRKRKEEKEKRAEKSLGVRKTAFSTKKARILTSSESITALSLTKEMTKVNGLKADPLREYLEKTLQFPLAELKQEGGRKWKTVDVLKKMAEEKLNEKWEEKVAKMDDIIQRTLVPAPTGILFDPPPPQPIPVSPSPPPAPPPLSQPPFQLPPLSHFFPPPPSQLPPTSNNPIIPPPLPFDLPIPPSSIPLGPIFPPPGPLPPPGQLLTSLQLDEKNWPQGL